MELIFQKLLSRIGTYASPLLYPPPPPPLEGHFWDETWPRKWGRSNLGDPAEWSKIGWLNRRFGSILFLFLEKQQNQSTLNFLQFGPRKFAKSDFRDIGPDPMITLPQKESSKSSLAKKSTKKGTETYTYMYIYNTKKRTEASLSIHI